MKVIALPAGRFRLTVEHGDDQQLLDALDVHRTVDHITLARRPPTEGGNNTAAELTVDRLAPQALDREAARQALSALRQLFRLGLGDTALHGHVGTNAADPQAQEQLAARVEQLELVLQTLGHSVSQQHLRQVVGGHSSAPLPTTVAADRREAAAEPSA